MSSSDKDNKKVVVPKGKRTKKTPWEPGMMPVGKKNKLVASTKIGAIPKAAAQNNYEKEALSPGASPGIGHNEAPAGPSPAEKLEKIRLLFAKARRLLRKELNECIADACAVGLRLGREVALWNDFVDDHRWNERNRPKSSDQKNAVRYVLWWVFAQGGTEAKTASLYYRAVSPLLEAGIAPKDLAAEIKRRGGLKKLAAKKTSPVGDAEHKNSSRDNAEVSKRDPLTKPTLGEADEKSRKRSTADDEQDAFEDMYVDPPEPRIPSIRSISRGEAIAKAYENNTFDAVIGGNIVQLVSLPAGHPLVLRGHIVSVGKIWEIKIVSASLDGGPE